MSRDLHPCVWLFLFVLFLAQHRTNAQTECWSRLNDTHVRDGFHQPSITSEDACKSACLSSPTCAGIDWNNVDKGCWFATNATDPTKYNQTGITHWDLNRTCNAVNMSSTSATTMPIADGSGSTTLTTLPTASAECWSRFNDTHVRGGFNQPLITSEDACKSSCLSSLTCVSVDWNNVDKGCWFATNATDPTKYNQTGITHWKLNRKCNAGSTTPTAVSTVSVTSIPSSASTTAAECWSRFNDTHVRGGFNQLSITSEDDCKSSCFNSSTCTGVDWNNIDRGCWFTTNATDPTKYNQTGLTHWELNRTCNAESSTASTVSSTTIPSLTSAFKGECWLRFNDTNVRGGFNQPSITSEDACKSSCLSSPTCVSVDWNNVDKGCWFATNATDPTKYNQTGIIHWELNRTCNAGLPESTTASIVSTTSLQSSTPTSSECWLRFNDTNIRGGFHQPLITSEDACKSSCLSSPTCAGIDWNNVDRGCWFATNATDPTKYNQTNITHWDLNRTCNAERTTISAFFSTTSTPTSMTHAAECWSRFNDTHVRGGFNQPSITSEDACKSSCLSSLTCVSVDWNNIDKGCWFATNATDPTKYNQTGITHWELNRTCNADRATLSTISPTKTSTSLLPPATGCIYNWTVTNNSRVTEADLQMQVTSEASCLTTCQKNSSCAGVDWNILASQCWFMTNTTDPTKLKQEGINHWEFTKFCIDANSVRCSNVWSLTNGAYSTSERVLSRELSNETACRAACISNPNCTGIDWTVSSGTCYLDLNSVSTELGGATTHWDIFRRTKGPCTSPCAFPWVLYDNKSATDAVAVKAVDEAECRSACVRAWPDCKGLDYTSDGSCLLSKSITGLVDSPGTKHWSLEYRTFCSPCTTIWMITIAYTDVGRVYVGALATDSECRTGCVNELSCTGFEFSNGNCYFSGGNRTRLVSSSGIFHFDIVRSSCGNGCLGSWVLSLNTRTSDRVLVGDNRTELDCKIACVFDSNCSSIDYVVSTQQCYLGFQGNSIAAFGTNHFERIRDLNCVSSPGLTTPGLTTVVPVPLISTSTTMTTTVSTPFEACRANWSEPIVDANSLGCEKYAQYRTEETCRDGCLLVSECVCINFNTANNTEPYDCYICRSPDGSFPKLYGTYGVVTYQLLNRC